MAKTLGEWIGGMMDDCGMKENLGILDRMRRFSIEDFLFHLLATEWCGSDHVPLENSVLYARDKNMPDLEYVFSFVNDSFEIGIGYPNKWLIILRRPIIHRFIFWYLWKWGYSEWFGLRRWIWYGLLTRRVNRHKRG